MSNYRQVKCYVTNNTDKAINYADAYLSHGEFDSGGQAPVSAIDPGAQFQRAFYVHKTTGSAHGCTGNVIYTLPDGSQLVFMFNCPLSFDGSGSTGNCWFYATIANIPAGVGATNYYVRCDVSICDKDGKDCHGMSTNPPTNNEGINAYVYVNPA